VTAPLTDPRRLVVSLVAEHRLVVRGGRRSSQSGACSGARRASRDSTRSRAVGASCKRMQIRNEVRRADMPLLDTPCSEYDDGCDAAPVSQTLM